MGTIFLNTNRGLLKVPEEKESSGFWIYDDAASEGEGRHGHNTKR